MAVIPTIRLFDNDPYLTEVETSIASNDGEVVCLDETVFYAESGGQSGDTGVFLLGSGEILPVKETRYVPGRLRIAHILAHPVGANLTGQRVLARLDWDRRHRLMRMHSCLHLLCSLVEAPVTGCAIHPDHGRLDFDIEATIDRQAVSDGLNALIERDLPVELSYLPVRELRIDPALVRTVQVAPPETGGVVRIVRIGDVDRQPCGGTHVRSTGEIGPVAIASIEKKGRRNRRIKITFADHRAGPPLGHGKD
ncbi:MAG: alanyl-tRNA editing protein [Methanobacterium sp.]|nr:alanyl-tRNA editing protein [Methanobacterium sp.]